MAAIRPRWPWATRELRADSVFAMPALYAWGGAEGIGHTIGLITNARLEEAVANLQPNAQQQALAADGATCD